MSCIFTTTFGEQVKVAVIKRMDELKGIHQRDTQRGDRSTSDDTAKINRHKVSRILPLSLSLCFSLHSPILLHCPLNQIPATVCTRSLAALLASGSRKTRPSGTRPFSRPALIRLLYQVHTNVCNVYIYVILGR
jgi:hypothetical protein